MDLYFGYRARDRASPSGLVVMAEPFEGACPLLIAPHGHPICAPVTIQYPARESAEEMAVCCVALTSDHLALLVYPDARVGLRLRFLWGLFRGSVGCVDRAAISADHVRDWHNIFGDGVSEGGSGRGEHATETSGDIPSTCRPGSHPGDNH